jgi:beta-lactamase regulating signal transducer with metallopeptidase domain/HEAT repeat protein
MPQLDSYALPALILLVKATCVLLVALGASLLLQRASAGMRHLVWLTALAGLLALPAMAAWGPLPVRMLPAGVGGAVESWPLRFAQGNPRVQGGSRSGDSEAAPASAPAPVSAPKALEAVPEPAAGSAIGLGTAIAAAWAVVAGALLLRLAWGAWSVHRIVARARPLDDPDWQTPLYEIADRLELEAAPRLLRSDDVKMPFAAGLLASTIVLPAESDGWSAERRTAVLIHELGHVRRRDLVGHTLSRVACALWWFHPLVWTAARRLRAESERACDDLALVFGARPSDYAEHLLDIVSCVRDHNTPAVALAMAHRREFEGRMLAILDPELRRRGPGRLQTAALVSGLATLALAVGAAAPAPRENGAPEVAPADISRAHHVHVAVTDSDSTIDVDVDTSHARVAVSTRAARRLATSDTGPQPSQRAEILAKLLRTDSSASVRRIAAWGLNDFGDVRVAVEALIQAVTGDRDGTVREMAAWSLAEADDEPAASAALGKALRTDKDPKVRTTATWALGEVGDASAVDALVGLLNSPDAATRELAAWSIGSCEPHKAPQPLVALLRDRERDVRLSAAWALFQIEDGAAAGAVEAAYQRETDPAVRTGLIRALGAMGDSAVGALERLVGSRDTAVRSIAIAALAGGEASGPWPWPRPEPRPSPDDVDE